MAETILIVDDSPFIVDGLAAILSRKGYTPVTASGGEECLTILKTVLPDIILLDIMMEPTDGWETLEKIRENQQTKDIPVLMFSAKKITPAEAEEHSMNIDDFVSKPVNPSQLLGSIQRVFSRRNELSNERVTAQDKGIAPATIEEYASLKKNIEVDRNLLQVLRTSSGMNIPGREVSADDVDALKKLEEKISQAEKRLQEISESMENSSRTV